MVIQRRSTPGKKFNEGARLMWLALARGEWSVQSLADATRAAKATVYRVLYGDRVANRTLAIALRDLIGIPVEAWDTVISDFEIPVAALTDLGDAPASTPSLPDDAPAKTGT